MPKVLVEIKNGTVLNVETTSEDVEVYVVEHDVVSDGSIDELKRYVLDLDAPVHVDAVVLEDELMTRLEDLSAEEQAKLERMTGVWDDDDEGDADGVTDLTRAIRSRR